MPIDELPTSSSRVVSTILTETTLVTDVYNTEFDGTEPNVKGDRRAPSNE
jgi:hypothetical protein